MSTGGNNPFIFYLTKVLTSGILTIMTMGWLDNKNRKNISLAGKEGMRDNTYLLRKVIEPSCKHFYFLRMRKGEIRRNNETMDQILEK